MLMESRSTPPLILIPSKLCNDGRDAKLPKKGHQSQWRRTAGDPWGLRLYETSRRNPKVTRLSAPPQLTATQPYRQVRDERSPCVYNYVPGRLDWLSYPNQSPRLSYKEKALCKAQKDNQSGETTKHFWVFQLVRRIRKLNIGCWEEAVLIGWSTYSNYSRLYPRTACWPAWDFRTPYIIIALKTVNKI